MFKSRRVPVLLLLALTLVLAILFSLWLDLLPDVLSAPRVTAVIPADGATDILPDSPITITFSAPMDRAATAGAVVLDPNVGVSLNWTDDRTLVVSPRPGLPISTTLTVRVSVAARSRLARPMARESVSRFTTLARPYLVASAPAPDARFVYTPDRVTLTFNRPLDRDSLEHGLVITPTLPNLHYAWNGNAVTLFGFFAPRTRYELTVPRTVVDARYQLPLDQDIRLSFTTTGQYPHFALLNLARYLDFAPNQTIRLETQVVNISRLDTALYALSSEEFVANLTAPFDTWQDYQPPGAPLKTWRVGVEPALDQYHRSELALEPLAAGFYYVRVTTPEGPSDAQLLVVTDLVVKVERSLERVQVSVTDRRAGAPVAQAALAVYDMRGEKIGAGVTGPDGAWESSLACGLVEGDECLDPIVVLASHEGDAAVGNVVTAAR